MSLKLAVRNGQFENAPEGTTQGVVVDVIDLGQRPNRFKPGESVHQVSLAFQLEDETSTGAPFVVRSYPMTASMDRKANLRKTIEIIRGPIKDEELDENGEFDIESIIGANCMVTVEHTEKEGKVYANAVQFGALARNNKTRLEPRDYVRVQDREDATNFDTEQLEAPDEALATAF